MEYPFERAAMRGDPMPEGLTGAEQLLFQSLALLYARYHAGQIDRDAAKREKALLERTYRVRSADCVLWARTAAMWAALEGPMAIYNREKTIEHAERCFEVLYGVRRAD